MTIFSGKVVRDAQWAVTIPCVFAHHRAIDRLQARRAIFPASGANL
ncbi:MAG TPA: hypothetical protein VGL82_13330 [Bryobacteraceae bacterium]